MNQEIKARWVSALRSGEYKQSRGKLKSIDGFCVLGVLCDLYAIAYKINWEKMNYSYKLCGRIGCLPSEVSVWADYYGAEIKLNTQSVSLTSLNDHMGYNFNEIADLIEQYL